MPEAQIKRCHLTPSPGKTMDCNKHIPFIASTIVLSYVSPCLTRRESLLFCHLIRRRRPDGFLQHSTALCTATPSYNVCTSATDKAALLVYEQSWRIAMVQYCANTVSVLGRDKGIYKKKKDYGGVA